MDDALLGNLGKNELQDILNEALMDVMNNVPLWPSEPMAAQMSIEGQSFGMCIINDVVTLYYKGTRTITFFFINPKKETQTMKVYYNKTTHQFIAVEGLVAITSYVANLDELPKAAQTAMAKELALGDNGSVCDELEFTAEKPTQETKKEPVPPQAPDYEKGEKVGGQQP